MNATAIAETVARIDSTTSDEALVSAIAAGDRAAAGILFTRHHVALREAARAAVGRHDETIADDAVADVFLILIEGRAGSFQPARGRVLPWLKGIACSATQEHLRGRTSADVPWGKKKKKRGGGGGGDGGES
jgi:DNA-directed RNA polymerase specialized sigma24 family protein